MFDSHSSLSLRSTTGVKPDRRVGRRVETKKVSLINNEGVTAICLTRCFRHLDQCQMGVVLETRLFGRVLENGSSC